MNVLLLQNNTFYYFPSVKLPNLAFVLLMQLKLVFAANLQVLIKLFFPLLIFFTSPQNKSTDEKSKEIYLI